MPFVTSKIPGIDGVMANLQKRQEVYESLPPDVKAAQDEYIHKLLACRGDLEAMVALGDAPIKPYLIQAGVMKP